MSGRHTDEHEGAALRELLDWRADLLEEIAMLRRYLPQRATAPRSVTADQLRAARVQLLTLEAHLATVRAEDAR